MGSVINLSKKKGGYVMTDLLLGISFLAFVVSMVFFVVLGVKVDVFLARHYCNHIDYFWSLLNRVILCIFISGMSLRALVLIPILTN